MDTWTEGLVGDATVTIQPMSIATSKPSNSTKKSRVSAVRSDLMFGTALLTITLRVLSDDRPITPRDAKARSTRPGRTLGRNAQPRSPRLRQAGPRIRVSPSAAAPSA